MEPIRDFDRLREAFQGQFEELSPQLQRIAQYALGEPNRFALQTVVETAREVGVQPSALIRFAKAFGYSGFSEMQQVFRLRLIEGAPSYRDRIFEQRDRLESIVKDDPSAILTEFADASVLAVNRLKAETDGVALRQAVQMMDEANNIFVIGQRRGFPVAAYLAYGLIRLEYRCQLLDSVGGMLAQQVATMQADDLLIAVSFAEYARPVVEIVSQARIRKIPVLALTDSAVSPLARQADLYFAVPDSEVHRFRPLAAQIVLAQSLILALGYYRDARIANSMDGSE